MTLLFVLFVLLGFWHLYYEQVIAATLKQKLKFDFFHLRDELRSAKMGGIDNKNDVRLYKILDDSLCDMIYTIDDITITNYIILKRKYQKDKAYKKVSNYVQKLTEKSNNQTLIKVDKRMTYLGAKALLINHFGLLPYLFVPLIIWLTISYIGREIDKLKGKIEDISSRMVYNSANRIKYTPSGRAKIKPVHAT